MKKTILKRRLMVAILFCLICFGMSACKDNIGDEKVTTSEREYYEEFINVLTEEDAENAKEVAQAYYDEGKADLSEGTVIEEIKETIAVYDYRHAKGIIEAEKLIDLKEIVPGKVIIFQAKAVSEDRIDYRQICLVKNNDNMWNVIYEML